MKTCGLFAGAALLAMFGVLIVVNPSYAQGFEATADEFRVSCTPCHGQDGKGDGYLVQMSNGGITTSDLTQLAKKNDGVFPLPHVFQVIDGSTQFGAHGDRAMPVWGDRYMKQAEEKYGVFGRGAAVRSRILELVYYLQSIQEK